MWGGAGGGGLEVIYIGNTLPGTKASHSWGGWGAATTLPIRLQHGLLNRVSWTGVPPSVLSYGQAEKHHPTIWLLSYLLSYQTGLCYTAYYELGCNMVKLKGPLHSLDARGTISKAISFVKRQRQNIAEKKPEVKDVKSAGQLSWRHMYQKCAALWHDLSAAEQADWNSLGGVRHMTGFAYWQSQCLRPNPGIYLPLQGGTMQGIIDMDGFPIQDLLDPVNPQDADTEAARDAAIADALEDCIDSHIHGWDGANWQRLLTQSDTRHNLRVTIYDSSTEARVRASLSGQAGALGGLVTNSFVRGRDGNTEYLIGAFKPEADGKGVTDYGLVTVSYPYGFNGATWDRLRSYGTGILKVGRAEVGLLTARMVGVGQVGTAAPHKLYWITMNPSAGASVMELSNAVGALGAVVYDHFHTGREAHHVNLDPPMEFTTGIYLETLANMTSMIFGYI